jgi:hypothetical protein
MTAIKFTHANHKTDMYLLLAKICGYYRSEQHKCTFIVSDGQTVFPAMESVEDVRLKIESANQSPKENADVPASSV